MKEIQKVVQKLWREQETAAGGRRQRRTNQYKNIKSSPVYWGDLITLDCDLELFLITVTW